MPHLRRASRSQALLAVLATAALTACGPSDGEEGAAAPAEGGAAQGPAAIEVQTSESRPQSAAPAAVLARGLIDDGRAEAQVVEAARSGGVLTVRTRFVRQAAAAEGYKTLYNNNPAEIAYVVAGDKKYFLLTDTEGKALAPSSLQLDIDEDRPLAATWWGKFPAPPPEVTTVSLILPGVEAIDGIALKGQ